MTRPSESFTKHQIQQDIISCRQRTLSLFRHLDYEIDYKTFSAQAHPEFSPAGWHLGHIAYSWDHWILVKCAGLTPTEPKYTRLFAVDGLAKADRVRLPNLADVCDYVNLVGDRLLTYLQSSSTFREEVKLWRWLIQHESQHAETAMIVLQLLDKCHQKPHSSLSYNLKSELITIPSGYFEQGNNSIDAMDNESSAQSVYVDSFSISNRPVSQSQYQSFINAGGYSSKQWWSSAGWEWLHHQKSSEPLILTPLHNRIFDDPANSPVCGINWYEADAYARFAGMRLPSESEWEKAANYLGDRMMGRVWEWTSTLFHPYPNYLPFPYSGYSSTYFDQQHYVLKGGSWASSSYTLRSPFRNWYQPHVRQIFAGLRCVKLAIS